MDLLAVGGALCVEALDNDFPLSYLMQKIHRLVSSH